MEKAVVHTYLALHSVERAIFCTYLALGSVENTIFHIYLALHSVEKAIFHTYLALHSVEKAIFHTCLALYFLEKAIFYTCLALGLAEMTPFTYTASLTLLYLTNAPPVIVLALSRSRGTSAWHKTWWYPKAMIHFQAQSYDYISACTRGCYGNRQTMMPPSSPVVSCRFWTCSILIWFWSDTKHLEANENHTNNNNNR